MAGTPQITNSSDCLKIMFGGNIGEAQDFECILNAAELLKGRVNVRWIIVGDGRKKTWVAGELQKRGLEDAVILLGSFPPCHMPNLFFEPIVFSLRSSRDLPLRQRCQENCKATLRQASPSLVQLLGDFGIAKDHWMWIGIYSWGL